VRSVSDVMLMLKQTIKTSHSDVRGCCILPNGKMVFVDNLSRDVIILPCDREHLITGVMELSFKSIRISPLPTAQHIRDPSLYVIPCTSDLVL
jgi:hypothetical protein